MSLSFAPPISAIGNWIAVTISTALTDQLDLVACFPVVESTEFLEAKTSTLPAIRVTNPAGWTSSKPGHAVFLKRSYEAAWIVQYQFCFDEDTTDQAWGEKLNQDLQSIAAVWDNVLRADWPTEYGYPEPPGYNTFKITELWPSSGGPVYDPELSSAAVRIATGFVEISVCFNCG